MGVDPVGNYNKEDDVIQRNPICDYYFPSIYRGCPCHIYDKEEVIIGIWREEKWMDEWRKE